MGQSGGGGMKRSWLRMEFEDLPVGKTRMIGWEAVTRWADDCFEIGTWGVASSGLTLEVALDKLCLLRHVE